MNVQLKHIFLSFERLTQKMNCLKQIANELINTFPNIERGTWCGTSFHNAEKTRKR